MKSRRSIGADWKERRCASSWLTLRPRPPAADTLFARLRRVRVQCPKDLSANHDAYAVGDPDG